MATIEKRGERWRARVRMRGYPEQTKTFRRKTDAKEWATSTEAKLTEGEYLPAREAKRRTVADMVDKYIKDYLPHKDNNKDAKKVEALLGWWRKEIGAYKLSAVTPALIVECRDKLRGGRTYRNAARSGATVNRYLSALSHALKVAKNDWHWITTSPMANVSRLADAEARVRFLSDDERKALLRECKVSKSPYLYLLVVLAISTGGRHGELINLRWRDVDLQTGLVILHDTKNRERRSLHLSGHALELMKAHAKVRHLGNDLVFPGSKKGKPADTRIAFQEAIQRAGIEDLRFHDLRHTAASYLAMNGATLAEIAEILGHKTLQMVKRYAHIAETHKGKVVERMNAKVFGDA